MRLCTAPAMVCVLSEDDVAVKHVSGLLNGLQLAATDWCELWKVCWACLVYSV